MIQKVKIKKCRFCSGDQKSNTADYKDVAFIKQFTTERGKILPRRITGTCARHQRMIARAVKRARHAALVPFQAD